MEAPEETGMKVSAIEGSAAPTQASDISPSDPVAPAEPVAVSYQTIADAYGSFTRKSLEQTSSFFEQLAGARSINRAFELHAAFAQQTFQTFVAESRKIGKLHSELVMQKLRTLEGFLTGRRPTRSS